MIPNGDTTTMFYCDSCAEKHGWPRTGFKSYGICEMCRAVDACNDTPSRLLPDPPRKNNA